MRKEDEKAPHKNKETLSAKEWMAGVRIYLQVQAKLDLDKIKAHTSERAKKAYANGYAYDYYAKYMVRSYERQIGRKSSKEEK